MLARRPEDIKVADLLDAIQEPAWADARAEASDPKAVSDVHRRNQAVRSALGDLTLRSLVSETDRSEATVADLTRYRRREG